MAVDLGEKRIGLALSDPSRTIARPLVVISHVGRLVDAAAVVSLAAENGVVLIVVGQPLSSNGEIGPGARHAARFADELGAQTSIPITLWDESGSTQAARQVRIEMGVNREKRRGHMDDAAAAIILQTYLDAHPDLSDFSP